MEEEKWDWDESMVYSCSTTPIIELISQKGGSYIEN
jgi:hypothetical protein